MTFAAWLINSHTSSTNRTTQTTPIAFLDRWCSDRGSRLPRFSRAPSLDYFRRGKRLLQIKSIRLRAHGRVPRRHALHPGPPANAQDRNQPGEHRTAGFKPTLPVIGGETLCGPPRTSAERKTYSGNPTARHPEGTKARARSRVTLLGRHKYRQAVRWSVIPVGRKQRTRSAVTLTGYQSRTCRRGPRSGARLRSDHRVRPPLCSASRTSRGWG